MFILENKKDMKSLNKLSSLEVRQKKNKLSRI